MALVSFAGLASGIDSTSLIQALLDQQREARIQPLQTQINNFNDTNDALSELSSLLNALSDAAGKYRTINGGPIAKQATSSNETIVTASASNSASAGTYGISVTTLASNATFSFDDRFSSGSDVIDSGIMDLDPEIDRTVSFTVGSGAGAENIDIVMTGTTTAQDFVTEFNSQSSKAEASLVNTGTESSPSYAIVISSKQEGTEDGTITLNAVGSSITAFSSNSLDQATDASFSIDGIAGTITRSSNTISDVISGVSFNLEDTGSATITISADTTTTESNLQAFVDAYNEIVEYIAENDAISQEEESGQTVNIFGPLASTSLDENILSALRSTFSSAGISGGSVNVLADLGITTNRDGTLDFDTEKFQDALNSSPGDVESILTNLGEGLSSINGTIAQFTRFNGIIDLAEQSNSSQITSLQSKISDTEDSLARYEESLVRQFARLEGLIGQMQNQQSTLASILPS